MFRAPPGATLCPTTTLFRSGGVKAVREAALARKAGDNELALEHLGAAVETTYNCINTLSDVARNQSDRALIAALNKYAFRPLVQELERLEDAE